MSARTIRLLHVEDDPIQHLVLAKQLQALPGFLFVTTVAEGEDDALHRFGAGGAFDLVLVDYLLRQGDGLNLLRRLRQADPVVPIFALSGAASSEVAAKLVQAGADDFFSKIELDVQRFASCLREALSRADALRPRLGSRSLRVRVDLQSQLQELCQFFAQALGATFVQRLDAFEQSARLAGLTPEQLESLSESAVSALTEAIPADDGARRRLLRPLLLDLAGRLASPR